MHGTKARCHGSIGNYAYAQKTHHHGGQRDLDYTEQSSWLLFLKYLDALEADKALEAELDGKTYRFIIDQPYRWESWATPKGADGKLDHNTAMTGYNLRDVIELVDELRFRSQTGKHELSHLYESKIKNRGNAGRNGGEYYSPRPLIRAMIHVLAPKSGERIYDGAYSSAGFLCEAFDYLSQQQVLTTSDQKSLQTHTFYGKQKKSLAYVIAWLVQRVFRYAPDS